nr:hypothetical protein BaRGS_003144 [Batillaria attramentaria]
MTKIPRKPKMKDKVNKGNHSMNPGNSRVITQSALQTFQEEMKKVKADPYKVEMMKHVEEAHQKYDETKDSNIVREDDGVREEEPEVVFKAGQSKRIWNELYKVIDSSDVLIQTLDARDPLGTRCYQVEKYLKREKPHKHLIFVLNKVDLVPVWVTVRVENIKSPEDYIGAVLERARPEYLRRTYNIHSWDSPENFLEQIAQKSGKLLKGGEPDVQTTAKMILNDWQRGRIPFFVKPPGAENEEESKVSEEKQEAGEKPKVMQDFKKIAVRTEFISDDIKPVEPCADADDNDDNAGSDDDDDDEGSDNKGDENGDKETSGEMAADSASVESDAISDEDEDEDEDEGDDNENSDEDVKEESITNTDKETRDNARSFVPLDSKGQQKKGKKQKKDSADVTSKLAPHAFLAHLKSKGSKITKDIQRKTKENTQEKTRRRRGGIGRNKPDYRMAPHNMKIEKLKKEEKKYKKNWAALQRQLQKPESERSEGDTVLSMVEKENGGHANGGSGEVVSRSPEGANPVFTVEDSDNVTTVDMVLPSKSQGQGRKRKRHVEEDDAPAAQKLTSKQRGMKPEYPGRTPDGEVIQQVSTLKLWVALLDGFMLNTPNPLQLPGAVNQAIKDLKKKGMTSHNVFLAGHSLGGVFVGEYGQKHADQLKGILLFASYLTRDVRLSDYPLPVLTISGDLDGQTRITRIADTFEEFEKDVRIKKTAMFRTPVVVLPGVCHAQFASGPMPDAVKKRDLTPEVTSQTAYNLIANQTAAFLVASLAAPEADITYARTTLEAATKKTRDIMKPLLTVKKFDVNDENSDLLAFVAQYMEAIIPSKMLRVTDVVQLEYEFIFSKPIINMTGTYDPQSGYVPTVYTYSHLSYALNPMDISTVPSSPQQVAVKMKSFLAIQNATKIMNPDDGGNLTCKDFNQEAINQVMQFASPVAKQRYQTRGRTISLEDDVNCTSIDQWTTSSLELKETDSDLKVTSSGVVTSLHEADPTLSGMHYCKLLSTYRIMEWMYVDSLRNHTV